MIESFSCEPGKVVALDNGVDPDAITAEVASEPECDVPARYVLSAATLEAKKGHDILIEAFNTVATRDSSLHLVIAGRPAEPEYVELLERLRVNSPFGARIHVLKNLPHGRVMRMMAGALVTVLASRVEPFGIVVLEAGVLRRPAIATDVCGVVRRLDPSSEISIVPASDAESLAQALFVMLTDPAAREQQAELLHKRVLADFQWSRIARQYALLAEAR
ncbi:MAG: hypothetical protein AMXMBFR59_40510 [Rhodanobacteraceae bacterium]